MPRFMGMMQPIEILIIEPIYFLIILIVSGYIYYKTKEIYELTKHKGVFHFRNIFLYFGLAHFFRLVMLAIIFSADYFMPNPLYGMFNLVFVSYFSTMAIFSAVLSMISKKKTEKEIIPYFAVHSIAFLISVFVWMTRSHMLLTFVQVVLFFAAIVLMIGYSNKDLAGISKNKITYILLFLFWIISTLAFARRLFPWQIKIPLYIISAVVYLSVFFRVKKRLVNGKKRPA